MNIDRIIRWMTSFEKSAMTITKFGDSVPPGTNAQTRKSLLRTGLIDERDSLTELGKQTRARLLAYRDADRADLDK